MDENKTLKIRMTGSPDDLTEAMDRWHKATAPMRETADKIAAMNQRNAQIAEGFAKAAGVNAQTGPVIAEAIADLPDVRDFPNPVVEQAKRDQAMIDALQAIQSHLQAAERDRKAQHRWDVWTRAATIAGALAAMAAAVLAGIAL